MGVSEINEAGGLLFFEVAATRRMGPVSPMRIRAVGNCSTIEKRAISSIVPRYTGQRALSPLTTFLHLFHTLNIILGKACYDIA
jgi:hypothetical protein